MLFPMCKLCHYYSPGLTLILELIKETIEIEHEKVEILECYKDRVNEILQWKALENDNEFASYVTKVQQNYSIFNHPAPEFF